MVLSGFVSVLEFGQARGPAHPEGGSLFCVDGSQDIREAVLFKRLFTEHRLAWIYRPREPEAHGLDTPTHLGPPWASCPARPVSVRVFTFREALLFPRCLTERGRRDENDPVLGDVHGPEILHYALQIRHVLVQGNVLLGVLICSGGRWILQPKRRFVYMTVKINTCSQIRMTADITGNCLVPRIGREGVRTQAHSSS